MCSVNTIDGAVVWHAAELIKFPQTTISDLVQIPPKDFGKKSGASIEDYINDKYANKVIQKIGLCICMFDLLKTSEGLIGHGTGIVNVNVEFRLIVFRPFKGEVIVGKIVGADLHGIRIGLDFFNDIIVPPHLLFEGCDYNYTDRIWVWKTDADLLYFDTQEPVRFRVESEEWNDNSPPAPSERESLVSNRKTPYSIQVRSHAFKPALS
ncbi:MAG: hypothetical protein M1812_001530 [Candelaria pacifica]|nr:MAG: hypothetical protein M1812_001530 [Candelaria pacifica]